MREINFKHSITEKEFLEFNNWFVFERTKLRKIFTIYAVFYIVLLVLFFIFKLWAVFYGFLIFCLLIYVIYPLLVRYSAKKAYNSNKLYSQEVEYVINETGISTKSESSHQDVVWENVYLVAENKEYIYIFIALNVGHIIPKSILSSEDLDTIFSFFELYVPLKKRKHLNKK